MQTAPESDPRYAEIARMYSERLNDRTIPHPPVFAIFSAIPGSGKTTLALKLAADLGAQYINHDAMRDIVRQLGWNLDELYIPYASKLLNDEIMRHDSNKLIILDASIDRNPQMYYDAVRSYKAKPLIIRLKLPLSIIRKRLETRDGADSPLLEDLARYEREFDYSCDNVKADITLSAAYEYTDVLTRVKNLIGFAR